MERITEFYESIPGWMILMLIGAIIAIILISAFNKHAIWGFIILALVIIFFYNINSGELFSDFIANESIEENIIDKVEEKVDAHDNTGIFDDLFKQKGSKNDKPSQDPTTDSIEEELPRDENENSSFGFNTEAFKMITEGFSNIFKKEEN